MQLNKKNELLIRVYIVVFGFALFSLLLFSRAFKISYIEGDKWRARGDSLSMAYFPVSADRGNIYSDNGSLLAASIPYFELRMDLKADGLKEETFNEGVDSLAWNLSKTVMKDKTPEQVKNYLIRKRNAGDRYMLLAKKVNYEELEQIREFPILRKGQFKGGFIVKRHFTRFKPYGSLASRTIGLSRANAQSVGLEKFFDDHLKGEEGQKLMQRVGGGVWIPLNEHDEVKPRRGSDVKTTINVDFQDIAHGALKKSILHHQADWGVAVVMEVETGKVKAIVNLNRDGEQAWESYNHAIGTRTEPGSTMKMASVMTFMEDGIARPETMLPVYKGRTRICNNPLNDSEHYDLDEMSLQDVFEASSNVGIAKFAHANYGSDEGAKKFINRLKQYGLNDETGIELEGEKEPYIKNPGDHSQLWSCTSIPWMSIGYEVLLTPLQSLAFYNAVANDGKYMNPYLVESIVKGDKVIEEFSPDVKIEQIASWSTIQNIRKMMEGVVLRGTADDVKSDLFDFAGKTGTSRIDYGKGSTAPKKYQASFIGYFPVKQPKYTCIVLVNNPRKNGYYGSVVAGTVFREVAQKILAISPEIRIAEAEEQPEFRASNLAYLQGAKNELEILCSAMNISLNITTENDYTVLMPANENGLELQGRNIKTDIVPDVKGMSLSQAIHILENQGLTINIKGAGRILSQSIRPGTAANGQQVILRLG